jgi:hypothetical protein
VRWQGVARRALLGAAVTALTSWAHAGSLQFCDRVSPATAQQQDRLLRFAAVLHEVLDDTGDDVAIVSRTGLDLSRFGIRYSHAGVALRHSPNSPWSVRQLYYACDERRPRLFDQGLPGFVFGADDADLGHVSIVLLPREAADALEDAALDNPLVLQLLAGRYSANAYPFDDRYQNCNQWVAELLAAAWGPLPAGDDLRPRAQAWLSDQGYAPLDVSLAGWMWLAATFVPLVHLDDQPTVGSAVVAVRTSLPETIEAFVRLRLPGARHIELCHDTAKVVVRAGWNPPMVDCSAEPGDRVVTLR